ncbi:uncharacterized protein Dana_GF23749 [Drosophila ananassae]|uniref:Malate dehydrogenase n=1 Tax=Drosophila ananassae TaxID=7217 RepID=B3M655_DROAN|nr:malate dehydrogenase, mitochondrial [Drosophila ananassae]EDV40771.1 uncharacterized protein Dana_GF23749 [Drosophila ananassae]
MILLRACARLPKVPLCVCGRQLGVLDLCGCSCRRGLKVTVVGAAGGIGQPLSLLLKANPDIDVLSVHDLRHTAGVAADLSHICTKSVVKAFEGPKKLKAAMKGADIVVVPAGLPRKPGMARSDLIGVNASVAADVAIAASDVCPGALLAYITNPINTIVPLAAAILKRKGTFDPNRLFGVTTLDCVRAKTFLGDAMNVNPQSVELPVIGGHTGTTILPIISQCKPEFKGEEMERLALVDRIQEAGTEVVKAKAGLGSATLSMAYAANQFVCSLIKAILGKSEEDVVEYAYVESDVTKVDFFATRIKLGPQGVMDNCGLPEMDEYEAAAMKCCLVELKKDIELGYKLSDDFKNRECE